MLQRRADWSSSVESGCASWKSKYRCAYAGENDNGYLREKPAKVCDHAAEG